MTRYLFYVAFLTLGCILIQSGLSSARDRELMRLWRDIAVIWATIADEADGSIARIITRVIYRSLTR